MEVNEQKKKRYFEEAEIQYRNEGFSTAPAEDGRLKILWRGTPLCQVNEKGGYLYKASEIKGRDRERAFEKAIGIARTVSEYMSNMEKATPLQANGLEEGYLLLAEFNDTVLAGRESKFGAQFVTWEWDFEKKSLWQDHYFGNDYQKAKEDFGTRSGLVPKDRVLRDDQLLELYWYVSESLNNNYPIKAGRRRLLEGILDQISWEVDNIMLRSYSPDEKDMEEEVALGQEFSP